jgi:acid phosphatase type 7
MAGPSTTWLAFVLAFVLAAGCGDGGGGDDRDAERAASATVWAVGDGATDQPHDDAVAAFLEKQPLDRFLFLGDVYEAGTAADFEKNYVPGYGRLKRLTEPTPGDHEWPNREQGYDRYWAAKLARSQGRHYYSFDVAGWHFVSLNSQDPIGPGSRQLAWLRRHLARHVGSCTIVFVHKPRYNAGLHPDTRRLEAMWSALEGHAVAVLSGDDHNYQRFKPERAIVQFVAGTGGRERYEVDAGDDRLAKAIDDRFGALRLRLLDRRLEYAFVTVEGEELDSGTLDCP